MKGDLLRKEGLAGILTELSKHDNYAIVGPAGLYLRTVNLSGYEPPVFSKIDKIEIVGPAEIPCGHADFSGYNLKGHEKGFIQSASNIAFDKLDLKVASPEHLVFDYLLNDRFKPDIAAFLIAKGKIEPEIVRGLLKSADRQDLFYNVFLSEILYDFAS